VTAEPPDRSALDRFLAAIPVAIVAIVVLSFFLWQAASRKSPTIFSDELEWSQISRAIAATGHAARRGEPSPFKSLYAFLIAPGWWFHSTATAYAAIKYLDTVVMCLTAVPVYLMSRTLVPRKVALLAAFASICTSAMFYSAFLLPEVLAYPTFVTIAYLCVRSLSGGGRRWTVAAIVGCAVATQVRGELSMLAVAYAIAAAALWVAGPRGRRMRRGWSRTDHVGAGLLVLGALIVLNRIVSGHSAQFAVVTQSWQDRMWSLGFQAGSALAIGLGLLPAVAGLASLWLPARRQDPAWRGFAAFTASAILSISAYTAIKAAFLSTVFATRVEERNMIYLGPLLLVGAAVYFTAARIWVPGTLAAIAFVTWLVTAYGYQLDYPYFEAPGYGIAQMANRAWHWDQPTIRSALWVTCLVVGIVCLLPLVRRVPELARRGVLLVAALAAVAWMLTGEVTSALGSNTQATRFIDNLPKPLDWVDVATGGRPVTFLGQGIGDADGVWLLEFWNRSIQHVWSLDASAPGPGPALTPDVRSTNGHMFPDPESDYALTMTDIGVVGPTVATRPGLTLTRIPKHPWHLRDVVFGRAGDGWTGSDSLYAYLGPGRPHGTVTVSASRTGFCNRTAPPAHVTVSLGPVALTAQQKPALAHAAVVRRFVVQNCEQKAITLPARPPFAVAVGVSTVRPSDYSGSDARDLGAQVGWTFTPSR
jgi:hypothetical protein